MRPILSIWALQTHYINELINLGLFAIILSPLWVLVLWTSLQNINQIIQIGPLNNDCYCFDVFSNNVIIIAIDSLSFACQYTYLFRKMEQSYLLTFVKS